ncbi:unnamed protein product [Chrysoparadoxa australica]
MTIFIHAGKAGIQLGGELWSLAATMPPDSRDVLFSHSECLAPRFVVIDSEPRAIDVLQRRVRKAGCTIREEGLICDKAQGGCGNNWSQGFGSSTLLSKSLDAIRKEVERSQCGSFHMMYSLGGGTGSGFGSLLLQHLRAEYPSFYIICTCVAAFTCGDMPLQHYNTMLGLQQLEFFADAVTYHMNDDLLESSTLAMCSRSRSPREKSCTPGVSRRVSLAQMSSMLARDLAAHFFPSYRKGIVHSFDYGSLVTAACPDPSLKFMDLKGEGFEFVRGGEGGTQRLRDWNNLCSATAQASRCKGVIAVHALARYCSKCPPDLQMVQSGLIKGYACQKHQVTLEGSAEVSEPVGSLSACVNDASFADRISSSLWAAQAQLDACAYVHHYKRNGINEEDIGMAIDCCRGLVARYDSLRTEPLTMKVR